MRPVEILKALLEEFHLEDQIYEVREREGRGWEGPQVNRFGDLVQAAKQSVKNEHRFEIVDCCFVGSNDHVLTVRDNDNGKTLQLSLPKLDSMLGYIWEYPEHVNSLIPRQ